MHATRWRRQFAIQYSPALSAALRESHLTSYAAVLKDVSILFCVRISETVERSLRWRGRGIAECTSHYFARLRISQLRKRHHIPISTLIHYRNCMKFCTYPHKSRHFSMLIDDENKSFQKRCQELALLVIIKLWTLSINKRSFQGNTVLANKIL